MTKKKVLR